MNQTAEINNMIEQFSTAEPLIMDAVGRMLARCIVAGTIEAEEEEGGPDIDADYVTELASIALEKSILDAHSENELSKDQVDVWFSVLMLTNSFPPSVSELHGPAVRHVIPDDKLLPENESDYERSRVGRHIAETILGDIRGLTSDVSNKLHAVVVAFMATSTWLSTARALGAYSEAESADVVEELRVFCHKKLSNHRSKPRMH